MSLPEKFNHFEHLQDLLRREHNKVVRRWFKDLGNDWKPNTSTPRSALRVACEIDDKDTAIMTLTRLYLFYEVMGYGRKRLGVFYGQPAYDFQESFEGRPQVFLYFSQDKAAVPDGLEPVFAEISFRLMDETPETMTEQKAKSLAKSIANVFVDSGKGIYFSKGKQIVSYNDRKLGYKLQIYATNDNEGEKIIKKVLAVQGHKFDEDKMSVSNPKKASVNVAKGTKLVYGKQRKKRRWRPTARVRFREAYLYLHGLDTTIPLIDTSGSWSDAFYRF